MALNLQHMLENAKWTAGNGIFGARCRFETRAFIPMMGSNGIVTGMNGIVQTISVTDRDPFEVMPFLKGPGSRLGG